MDLERFKGFVGRFRHKTEARIPLPSYEELNADEELETLRTQVASKVIDTINTFSWFWINPYSNSSQMYQDYVSYVKDENGRQFRVGIHLIDNNRFHRNRSVSIYMDDHPIPGKIRNGVYYEYHRASNLDMDAEGIPEWKNALGYVNKLVPAKEEVFAYDSNTNPTRDEYKAFLEAFLAPTTIDREETIRQYEDFKSRSDDICGWKWEEKNPPFNGMRVQSDKKWNQYSLLD